MNELNMAGMGITEETYTCPAETWEDKLCREELSGIERVREEIIL